MNEPPIWNPRRENRVDADGICLMHGGPVGMQLPEHEHAELQIESHFTAGIERERGRVLDEEPSFLRIVPSGQPHIGRWEEGSEVIVFLLSKVLIDEAASELLRTSKCEVMGTTYASDPTINSLSRMLRWRFKNGLADDPMWVESTAGRLVEQLVRRFSVRSGEHFMKGQLMPWQLRLTVESIESRLEGRVGVRELASRLGIGAHQFTHHFRGATGISPYQYILKRKVERAKTLLHATERTLAQISHGLGFANQSHFTQIFRQMTGLTPRQFRLQMRPVGRVRRHR